MIAPLTEPRKELHAPPPLITQEPICPMCHEETESDGDGGWKCDRCKATWSGLDVGWEQGEWIEADILACQSMAKRGRRMVSDPPPEGQWDWQCAQPLGHKGKHHASDGATWPNSWLIQSDPEEEPTP